MNPSELLQPDSLDGLAGEVLVAIHPSPCRGPLAAIAVTKPAGLYLRQRGVEISAAGAYVSGGALFCRFTTTDLGAALPAVRAYFDELGCEDLAQLAYRPAGGCARYDFAPRPHRSYSSLACWTWSGRLRVGWGNFTSSPWFFKFRCWWSVRQVLGDLSLGFVVLAAAAGLVAWVAAFHDRLAGAVLAIMCSGLAFALAIVTRPLMSRAEAERLISRAIRDGQDERKEFLRLLKGEDKPTE